MEQEDRKHRKEQEARGKRQEARASKKSTRQSQRFGGLGVAGIGPSFSGTVFRCGEAKRVGGLKASIWSYSFLSVQKATLGRGSRRPGPSFSDMVFRCGEAKRVGGLKALIWT